MGDPVQAIQKGCESELKKWLGSHAVDEPLENEWPAGQTCLHVACTHGKLSIVKMLLKKGANVNKQDERGFSPFHTAASARQLDICEYLLFKHNKLSHPNGPTKDGGTAFSYICRAGGMMVKPELQLKLLNALLSKGAAVNLANERGETALHLAALSGSEEVVKFLIEHGANLNEQTKVNRDTPLHWCVQANNIQGMRALLDAGADPLLRNSEMRTPLGFARSKGKSGMVDMLEKAERAFEAAESDSFSVERIRGWNVRRSFAAGTAIDGKRVVFVGGMVDPPQAEGVKVPEGALYDVSSGRMEPLVLSHSGSDALGEMKGATMHKVGEDEVAVFGGSWGESRPSPHVYSIQIAAARCTVRVPAEDTRSSEPPVLINHCSTLYEEDGRRQVVCCCGSGSRSVCCFDLDTNAWTRFKPSGKDWPTMRSHASFVNGHNGKAYLFGGRAEDGSCLDDLYSWEFGSKRWVRLPAKKGAKPGPRWGHSAVVSGSSMWVWGGVGADGNAATGLYLLDLSSVEWSSVLLSPSSSVFSQARPGHVTVLSGSKAYTLFGTSNPSTATFLDVFTSPSEPQQERTPRRSSISSSAPSSSSVSPRSASVDKGSSESRRYQSNPLPGSGGGSSQSLLKISSPSSAKLSKRSDSEETSRIEELSSFSNKLATDSLALVTLLLSSGMQGEMTFTDESMQEEVTSRCQELQEFCVMHKPKKAWTSQVKELRRRSPSSLARSPSKTKAFSVQPFPKEHYLAMQLPAPWLSDRMKPPGKKSLEKRCRVVNELLATETSYVRDLGVLIGLYLRPLQLDYEGVIEQYDQRSLFKNVEQLFDVNVQLLARLEEEIAKPHEQQRIGEVFLSMIEELKKYNSYSANNQAGVETLNNLMSSNSQFAAICAEVKRQPESKQLDLGGYITKPFQRITRYPLLLREILEATPESLPDHDALKRAVSALNETVRGANEIKGVTDDLYKIVEIQNRFASLPAELAQLHKLEFKSMFACKLTAKGKLRKGEVFAFSEMVVLAHGKAGKLSFLRSLPTAGMKVNEDSEAKYGLQLVVAAAEGEKAAESVALVFKTQEDRNGAIAKLRAVASE